MRMPRPRWPRSSGPARPARSPTDDSGPRRSRTRGSDRRRSTCASAGGGAAESYRIAADEASVVVTGADAAGLFYGVQTLGQLIARDGDWFAIPRRADRRRPAVRLPRRDARRRPALPPRRDGQGLHRPRGRASSSTRCTCTSPTTRAGASSSTRARSSPSSPPATAVGGDPGGFYSTGGLSRDRRSTRHPVT